MRFRITLGPADRERLGAPESFDYDHDAIGMKALIAIQKATGLTPADYIRGLAVGDASAIYGMVWTALRGAGVLVDFDDFDFAPNQCNLERLDPEPASPGKESRSTPSTRTRSTRKSSTTKTSPASSRATQSSSPT